MLVALLLSTVVVSTNDSYHIPQVERLTLEGKCSTQEIKLTEQRGTMMLSVNGKVREISHTSFAKSYLSGSYIGRFTFACRRDGKEFSINFFGFEVPENGAPKTVTGSVSYDTSLSVSHDSAVSVQEINLHNFNIKRNERWPR